jgi:plasmid stabilization system protein ParE
LGGPGWADIVDLSTHAIYEVKTWTGAAQGLQQAMRYRDAAEANCDSEAPWHLGTDYPPRVIPISLTQEIFATQYPLYPGVIVYWERNRRLVPVPVPNTQTAPRREQERERQQPTPPVLIPVPVAMSPLEEIADFIRRVVASGEDAERAAQRFLQEHPEVRYLLVGAAVVIVIATIAEDIITLGAGLLDDPASLAVAWTLVRVAQQAQ